MTVTYKLKIVIPTLNSLPSGRFNYWKLELLTGNTRRINYYIYDNLIPLKMEIVGTESMHFMRSKQLADDLTLLRT